MVNYRCSSPPRPIHQEDRKLKKPIASCSPNPSDFYPAPFDLTCKFTRVSGITIRHGMTNSNGRGQVLGGQSRPRKRKVTPSRSECLGWAGAIARVRKHPIVSRQRGDRKGRGKCKGTNPRGPSPAPARRSRAAFRFCKYPSPYP